MRLSWSSPDMGRPLSRATDIRERTSPRVRTYLTIPLAPARCPDREARLLDRPRRGDYPASVDPSRHRPRGPPPCEWLTWRGPRPPAWLAPVAAAAARRPSTASPSSPRA